MPIITIFLCIASCMAQNFNRANFPAYKETRVNSQWTSRALQAQSIPGYNLALDVVECQNRNDWALTYDDGPGSYTGGVLQSLGDRNIKATFFVVGQQAVDNPNLLRQAFNDGHEIALHTWSHKDLVTLSNDQIVAEIVWNAIAIRDIIGRVPTAIRPPYGSIDNRVRSIIQALGLKIILWNLDTNDWLYVGQSEANQISGITQVIRDCIAGCSTKNPNRGAIVLEHDYPYAFAISNVLDIMRNSPFNLKTVSQCVGYDAYSDNWLAKVFGDAVLPSASSPPPVSSSPPPSLISPQTSNAQTAIAFTTSNSYNSTITEVSKSTSTISTDAKNTALEEPLNNASSVIRAGSSGIWTFVLVVLTVFLYI